MGVGVVQLLVGVMLAGVTDVRPRVCQSQNKTVTSLKTKYIASCIINIILFNINIIILSYIIIFAI